MPNIPIIHKLLIITSLFWSAFVVAGEQEESDSRCARLAECLEKKGQASGLTHGALAITKKLLKKLKGREKKEVEKKLSLYSQALSACEHVVGSTQSPMDILDTTKWIHGSAECQKNKDEKIQMVQVTPDTYVLRQNMCSDHEAPFMYVFFGEDKVFLQDTGATSDAASNPIRTMLDKLIAEREKKIGKKLELVVAHSHAHGDHTAGDGLFLNPKRPRTTVVGHGVEDIQKQFNIKNWPADSSTFNLGKRKLHMIPIPGHEDSSLAVYDEKTGTLLTGDTFYPGRLYINDFEAYRASIKRLVEFTKTHKVSKILGTHIEMTDQPKKDYEFGVVHHPNERKLPLRVEELYELDRSLDEMKDKPRQQAHDSFIITPYGAVTDDLHSPDDGHNHR